MSTLALISISDFYSVDKTWPKGGCAKQCAEEMRVVSTIYELRVDPTQPRVNVVI